MKKSEFLEQRYRALKDLPAQEVNGRLQYYSEMIDDRMEEGMAEDAAVAEVGSVEEIARLLQDAQTPEPEQKAKRSPLQLTLLIVSAPIWGSLLIAAAAVAIIVYAAAWAVLASLYAAVIAAGAAFLATIPLCIVSPLSPAGILFVVGCGLTCGGLAVLLFYGSWKLTKRLLQLTQWSIALMRKKVAGK